MNITMMDDYKISIGTLNSGGTLNENVSYNSQSSTALVGDSFGNGVLAGGVRSSSTLTRTSTLTISYLRIGNDVYSDIICPMESMFQILEIDDEIGIIVTPNGKSLLAVTNFSEQIQIKQPHGDNVFPIVTNLILISILLSLIAIVLIAIEVTISTILFLITGLLTIAIAIKLKNIATAKWQTALSKIKLNS